MENYNFIKSIPQEQFLQMVRRGIIPVHIMDWITMYEYYLHELKSNEKRVSIQSTSEYFNCSEKTVYNIINFLKK